MRTKFHQTLVKIAAKDERIFLLLGDLGYGEVEPFAEAYPDRYFNVGVAEQNMAGIACGLAMEGNIVVTYSIANFPTLRCVEQIRNDICYHKANVKIFATGGGMAYAALGVSHQATEDIAIMRALPDMVVISPADKAEAEAATYAMVEHEGPVFYRCGYKKEPDVHQGKINFKLGKAIQIRDGSDVTIIGTGSITHKALQAAEILAKEGIQARLLSMHTLKPIDEEAIIAAAKETGAVVTVEEHNVLGGLGGAVAEVLAETGVGIPFKRIGMPDTFVHIVGSHNWLIEKYGLSPQAIAEKTRNLLKK